MAHHSRRPLQLHLCAELAWDRLPTQDVREGWRDNRPLTDQRSRTDGSLPAHGEESTEIENSMTSAQRIQEYARLEAEPPRWNSLELPRHCK